MKGNFSCQCPLGWSGVTCNLRTGRSTWPLECCGESVWHLAAIIIGYLVGLLLMFLMAAMVWYGISLEPRRAPSTGDSALFYEDEYARAAGGAYVNEDVYAGGGYHHGMGTMSTLYGDRTLQRRQVVADTYGSEFYPAGGAVIHHPLPYSVPGSGTLGRRTIGSASTMGRGATLPKIAITPAGNGNLRQRNHAAAVATSTLPRSGSAVAHATVGPDVSYLESDDAQKATADWVIHSSTQHLAENSNHTDESGAAMNLDDDEDGIVAPAAAGTGLMQSSSFTKSFVMEQTVDGTGGGNLRGGKPTGNMSYRIKTPEDGFVKITTPDGAVKLNADGRSTLGKPSTGTGSGAEDPGALHARNAGDPHLPMPSMVPSGEPGAMQYSSQQTTSFSYEYELDQPRS